jgi:hypothetical protein
MFRRLKQESWYPEEFAPDARQMTTPGGGPVQYMVYTLIRRDAEPR